jgi:hypothetical protein
MLCFRACCREHTGHTTHAAVCACEALPVRTGARILAAATSSAYALARRLFHVGAVVAEVAAHAGPAVEAMPPSCALSGMTQGACSVRGVRCACVHNTQLTAVLAKPPLRIVVRPPPPITCRRKRRVRAA